MLIVDIKVIPGSGKQKCTLDKNNVLTYYLKSPPEQGKANDELCMLIARALKISRTDVVIVMGVTMRRKKVRIATSLTYQQLLAYLGIDFQTSFTKL